MKLLSSLLVCSLGGIVPMLAEAGDAQSTLGHLVELSIKLNNDSIALSCLPRTETAGKTPDWVIECNRLAYQYLIGKTGDGIEFSRQVNEKPFGMAADFMANTLMSDPSGFKAANISQEFVYKHKKT
ncbi:hypothetical protein [Shewanella livingstonensis]|uniref:DUF3718 domain-containing protein n=1 Tax=Shewanella livingstonensis TaxID=150120 RepID=A0A3G8LRN0_9GAMM|nr:hypothetical protein [Shewanella livingstonensis]AZG72171.1 hypothetical protein EGC82_04955 [Shewanella livingstonensis]